jgi:lipid-A-disaccharide synthase
VAAEAARRPPRFGIVAGEPSGDRLGAALMQALAARCPGAAFVGAGGSGMTASGLASLVPLEALSVNGFVDPLRRLPLLLRSLRRLRDAMLEAGVDAFIGIDFNVFNLLLERLLHARGVFTVHYVSPSVYAWRRGRVDRIARGTDLMLTLFPFEPALYAGTPVRAVFVGHPLADAIEPCADPGPARARLGVAGSPLVALMPGSRRSEVAALAPLFLRAARLLRARFRDARFVVPCIDAAARERLARLRAAFPDLDVCLVDGQSRTVLEAADVALVKSGTSTLEALLVGRPMVVAYRLGGVTFQVVRRMLRTPWVALPNILAGEGLVPELLQHAATPEALADAVEDAVCAGDAGLRVRFAAIGRGLRRDASACAAGAILDAVSRRSRGSAVAPTAIAAPAAAVGGLAGGARA